MKELEKYKELILYLIIIIAIAVGIFKQVQPKFVSTLELYNQVKTQKTAAESIKKQLALAKDKFEIQQKLRMLDGLTKKIYEPDGKATDSESTFAVLLDDVIEISRKNHIKTYSIKQTINPQEDVFIKGDKEHYSACRIDMKIVSNYSDLKGYISDLYQYPYIININNLEIYPYDKDKRVLLVNMSITLYVAKSAEEMESDKQREAKNAKNAENAEGDNDKKKAKK